MPFIMAKGRTGTFTEKKVQAMSMMNMKKSVRIRHKFEEVWLWETLDFGQNGEEVVNEGKTGVEKRSIESNISDDDATYEEDFVTEIATSTTIIQESTEEEDYGFVVFRVDFAL